MSASIFIGLGAGALLGLAYFGSLRFELGLIVVKRVKLALLVQVVRMGALGGGLTLLAMRGALALGLGAIALQVARDVLIRRLGAAP